MQFLTYFVHFSRKRPPLVSDHFLVHQGWSLTRKLTVIPKSRMLITGYLQPTGLPWRCPKMSTVSSILLPQERSIQISLFKGAIYLKAMFFLCFNIILFQYYHVKVSRNSNSNRSVRHRRFEEQALKNQKGGGGRGSYLRKLGKM